MSYRKEKFMSLAGGASLSMTTNELKEMARKLLDSGIHGICFSAYDEGQSPGDQLTDIQIRRKLEILKPNVKWVRTFSCTEGNEFIPKIARELGIKTFVGAWLGSDPEINKKEIAGLIKLANEGYVDIAAVGNEVMYRQDLSEQELLSFINEVKEGITKDVPVGYVDAYYEFEDRPKVTEACDVILSNCYPFWEGCAHPYAILYMQDMYRRLQKVAQGKRIIITETGWPSAGGHFYGAESSPQGAYLYFLKAMEWAAEENIEMFYFSSFDEPWKVAGDAGEGDVGAYWGLWDTSERFKYASSL